MEGGLQKVSQVIIKRSTYFGLGMINSRDVVGEDAENPSRFSPARGK